MTTPDTCKKIYLVRHGLTTARHGSFIGHSDIAMSPVGAAQIHSLIQQHRPLFEHVRRCYVSPLARCRQSYEVMQKQLPSLCATFHDELLEIDFGRWEQLSYEDIKRQDPADHAAWLQDPAGFVFPGGEGLSHLMQRAERFLKLMRDESHQEVLVIAHAGIIRMLVAAACNLKPEQSWLFKIDVASLTILHDYTDYAVLAGLNFTNHH
jgi:broad specificity phosphatase PhoE